MFNMVAKITIGQLVTNKIHEVEILDSIYNFTNTCTILMPKKVVVTLKDGSKLSLRNYIKPGMQVKIELGYNNKFNVEFVGYVAKGATLDMPMAIYCEDEFYKIKQLAIEPKFWKNAKLVEIIKHIAPNYGVDVLDINLGNFTITSGARPMDVLKILKDTFGIYTYWRGDKIYSGKPHLDSATIGQVVYKLRLNTAEYNIELQEDKAATMKYESMTDGKLLKSTFIGDTDGEVVNARFAGLSQAELNDWAKKDFERHKASKLTGTVTGFGFPFTNAGMAMKIMDNEFELLNSTNVIEEVNVKYNPGGFRRENKIGKQL